MAKNQKFQRLGTLFIGVAAGACVGSTSDMDGIGDDGKADSFVPSHTNASTFTVRVPTLSGAVERLGVLRGEGGGLSQIILSGQTINLPQPGRYCAIYENVLGAPVGDASCMTITGPTVIELGAVSTTFSGRNPATDIDIASDTAEHPYRLFTTNVAAGTTTGSMNLALAWQAAFPGDYDFKLGIGNDVAASEVRRETVVAGFLASADLSFNVDPYARVTFERVGTPGTLPAVGDGVCAEYSGAPSVQGSLLSAGTAARRIAVGSAAPATVSLGRGEYRIWPRTPYGVQWQNRSTDQITLEPGVTESLGTTVRLEIPHVQHTSPSGAVSEIAGTYKIERDGHYLTFRRYVDSITPNTCAPLSLVTTIDTGRGVDLEPGTYTLVTTYTDPDTGMMRTLTDTLTLPL